MYVHVSERTLIMPVMNETGRGSLKGVSCLRNLDGMYFTCAICLVETAKTIIN